MNKLRHVMIDLETMGKVPEMAIVSIGAVIFDPRYGKVSKETFYMELDWESQDRFICPETQEWWSKQSKEARSALDGLDELEESLIALAEWLPKDCKVWVTVQHLTSHVLNTPIDNSVLKSLGSFGMFVTAEQYWTCTSQLVVALISHLTEKAVIMR